MSRRPQRSTIGDNPLDAVVPSLTVVSPATPAARTTELERFSSSLPAELMERARNAVFWTPGATMAGLLEEGLRATVERREAERGSRFERRPEAKLRAGRQVK